MDRNTKMAIKCLAMCLFFSHLNIGCSHRSVATRELIGKWSNADGAQLDLKASGDFYAIDLPREYFSFPDSTHLNQNRKLSGQGHWRIMRDRSSFDQLELSFDVMDNEPAIGIYSLFVSGENGPLENKPPWYLFLWKSEEGGERYILKKK